MHPWESREHQGDSKVEIDLVGHHVGALETIMLTDESLPYLIVCHTFAEFGAFPLRRTKP